MNHRTGETPSGSHWHCIVVLWAAGVLLSGTLMARAQDQPPASAPTTEPARLSDAERLARLRALRAPERGRHDATGPDTAYSDADWTEASEFMRTHSPRRFEVFELLPDDTSQRRAVRRFMLTRYQNLKDYKATDPDGYESRLKRLETEDDVFGLAADVRHAEGSRRDELRAQLRARVGDLVDLGIVERQQKIARLEKLLQEERDRLATYQKGRDVLIEKRMEDALTSPGGNAVNGGPQGANDAEKIPDGAKETVAGVQPVETR